MEKAARFNSSPDYGLNETQVKERIASGDINVSTQTGTDSIKDIILRNLFTYFNLIFAVLACLLIIVREYRGLTFMPIVIANTAISIIQQIRAKKTLDKLNMLNAPTAVVIRNGHQLSIPVQKTVLDDIVLFCAGNQIYADAVILDGEVIVNEALLTGEADDVVKNSGDTLMSGSFIVSGKCRARLEKVGNNSYIAKLSAQAKQSDNREHSKILASLNKLIKIVGIIIIPIGIIMLLQQYITLKSTPAECVSSTVAALLGMIPEGLYLLASTALVMSTYRLAKRNVNVHDISCVETLARVNVFCIDKTGTITDNTINVEKYIPLNKNKDEYVFSVIADFADAMSSDNITMDAVKRFFVKENTLSSEKVVHFSPHLKYSAAVFNKTTYVLGAPEYILREMYTEYSKVIQQYMEQGFRVLVFAEYNGNDIGKPLTGEAKPLCLILLKNPIRKNAAKIFRYFYEQGVDIKVISGDSPVTASQIAMDAGIHNAEFYIDASTLKTENDIKNATKKYTVFGRVSPETKRSLIKAMQDNGDTVAMTGDGVNDVLALKTADCSVAMASGSEAAANTAQMVLMDSDFAHMPEILLEGRRVVNNIERSAGLFLIKNIFSFLLSVFSMIAVFDYPLSPAQVSLINMFTIGTPAFLLALENNKSRIQGSFLKNVIMKALPAALTNFITIAALVSYGNIKGLDDGMISTLTTFVISAIGFFVIFLITRPLNLFKISVLISMVIGFLLCTRYLKWWFLIGTVDIKVIVIFCIFTAFAYILLILIRFVERRIERYIQKRKAK